MALISQSVQSTHEQANHNNMREMKCSHCQCSFPPSALKHTTDASGKAVHFCCNGCEGVYMLLQQSGFGGFYERLGANTLTPISKQSPTAADLSYLDEETFLQAHTKPHTTPSGTLREISLIIDGIHCAACIWLNEHIVSLQKGVYKVHINYTNNKAKILFDPAIIPLSAIFSLIQSIGYNAHIYDPSTLESTLAREQRAFFISFVVGVFCTMSIMMVAIAQYAGYFYGMNTQMKDVLNLISCLLATPVLFYTGRVFFSGAYYGLRLGYIGMDFLVAFGASLTFLYSIYASITHSGESYFESVAMIILFVFSGKFLEMRARRLAGDSLDRLHTILPNAVEVESKNGLELRDVKSLQIGDVVHIAPGGMLPCDGTLLCDSMLDMQSLSGESLPVQKYAGDSVLSGAIVIGQSCKYVVQKRYEHSMMSVIITMLEESLASRPRIQNLANSLSKYFSRIVLAIAACGFIAWWLYASINQALIITISVIVIACPCALALATPIASVVGIARAYRAGLLFKEARFLEVLARASVVVFDKTGTLTTGTPKVCHTRRFFAFDENVLAHFVRLSNHPISHAIAEQFPTTTPLILSPIAQVDSRGITTTYQGVTLLGGSLQFLQDNGVDITQVTESSSLDSALDSMSVFGYSVGGRLALVCYLRDCIKPYAKELIAYLRSQGAEVVLLSGDRQSAVESSAKELGIAHCVAGLLPHQKAEYIHTLRASHILESSTATSYNLESNTLESNKHNATRALDSTLDSTRTLDSSKPTLASILSRKHDGLVVMIGDGLNDILALKSADVGISMGAGSDIAIAQSDIVVLDDSLQGVQNAFTLAHQTYTTILQNLSLSFIYNALLIPLALAGFVIPLVAALSMSLSSLLVVGNSLRKKDAPLISHYKSRNTSFAP